MAYFGGETLEILDSVPEYLNDILQRKQIDRKDIKMSAFADLTPEGFFCETWLLLTDNKLIAITGHGVDIYGNPIRAYNDKKKNKQVYKWEEEECSEYSVKDIESINAENLVATGMLTAKIKDDEVIICCFTNTHIRKFGMYAKLFNKVRDGKEITEEDCKDERARGYCPKCKTMYPDPVRKICPKCLNRKALFVRVLSFAPRYKAQLALILVCMLANTAMNLFGPYMSGRVLFDKALAKGSKYYGHVGIIVLMVFALKLLAQIIGIIYGRINSKIAAEIVYDIKCDIFTAMQKLSLSFFNNKQTGSLMNRVNNDANQIQNFFLDGVPYFISNAINIISISIIMVTLNWKLALLVLIPIPVLVYMVKTMYPKLWTLFSRRFRKRSVMNSIVNDSLTGVRVVKAFGKENSEIERFQKANFDFYDVNLKAGKLTSTMFPLMGLIMQIGGFIIWSFGGWQVVSDKLTFGTLMTFTLYLNMLYGPIDFMTNIVRWWSECMNSAQRIFEILDTVPDITDAPNPVRMPYIKGDIKLENVTFSYEPNKPVLHNINLDIKAGEMVGLVGHSGAGKSTLTNLITRLYDVNEGSIYIDGVDIRNIAIDDLRPQIGMVLQETYLFTGTIAENIAYAKPDASIEDIIRAAKAANAHDFIIKMPDGYETVIGKNKTNLSGGEKQRISIARAILHNPRILILDEATASLDTETERLIQEALERLVKGRTTIAIAHRLSTLRNADRLVVVEKGKIVEVGTHSELTNLKGVYYNLLQKQREALKIRGVVE